MRPGIKLFVGNVPEEATAEELSELFAGVAGPVLGIALMKQFAFVHLRDEAAAARAIAQLNGHQLHGRRIVVEPSRPRPTNTCKIFVGNVSAACTSGELRSLFQQYGTVVECDVVKGTGPAAAPGAAPGAAPLALSTASASPCPSAGGPSRSGPGLVQRQRPFPEPLRRRLWPGLRRFPTGALRFLPPTPSPARSGGAPGLRAPPPPHGALPQPCCRAPGFILPLPLGRGHKGMARSYACSWNYSPLRAGRYFPPPPPQLSLPKSISARMRRLLYSQF